MPRAARHDAAQGPGGAASDNDAVVAAAGSACLPAGWSAGRRLLRYPFGSHPEETQEGASGRNSQSRPFLAQATARGGTRTPKIAPREASQASRALPGAPLPFWGKRKKGQAAPTPLKQPGGGALAKPRVIPGPSQRVRAGRGPMTSSARSPESIIPGRENET